MAKASDNDLLPSGSGGPEASMDGEVDLSDLRVNFSEEEATSEAFSFDPVPTGTYLCAITDIEVRRSKSEKNPGKPYWNVTLTAQGGDYDGRKFWGSVMLWEGALYSLSQLLKATGFGDRVDPKSKTYGKIPSADELMGKQVLVNIVKKIDKYAMEQNGDGKKVFKNDVSGYKEPKAGATPGAGASGSLLP